jgi:hypothetical protein
MDRHERSRRAVRAHDIAETQREAELTIPP